MAFRRLGFVLTILLLVLPLGASAQKSPEDESALAAGEDAYKGGDYERAIERLQSARQLDSNDPRPALLLGLTYLKLDKPREAAVQWSDYVRLSTDRRLAGDVGKFIPILLHEDNARAARAAIAEERQLSAQAADPKAVAVAAFRNLGSAEYAPLGKALAAMLIDNLSALSDLRVLERDRVEALVTEANLGATGLVEKGSAVRAGKLLRAGRVVPGSYADWTESPTRLKTEASVYEVDSGRVIATSSAEAPVTGFYELVPRLAAELSAALGRPVSTLAPDTARRVENSHTKSLPAVLAFGRALDAADRTDMEGAKRACEEAQKEDPNFELARRFCGWLPPVWLSLDGVASAVESQVALGAPSFLSQAAPWIAGAVVVGGVAGGLAATSGGGGSGGGNDAPNLRGVQPTVLVSPGETLTESLSSRDPDGDVVTLSASNLPASSTFVQIPGTDASGQFRFTPTNNDAGRTFAPRFCATDTNGGRTCRTSQVYVSQAPKSTPTITPLSGPTPFPGCVSYGGTCTVTAQCCDNVPCIGGRCSYP